MRRRLASASEETSEETPHDELTDATVATTAISTATPTTQPATASASIPSAIPSATPRRIPLWRNWSFLTLFGGQAISNAGSGATEIALPLVVLLFTGSVVHASILAATRLAIYALLALPAGAMVDHVARGARKRLMVGCELSRAALLLAMPVALLMAPSEIGLPIVYALVVIEAICWTLFDLSVTSILPALVAEDQLGGVAAAATLTTNMQAVLGQPLGALLLQLGRFVPFVVDATTYLLSSVSLLLTRFPHASTQQRQEPEAGPTEAASPTPPTLWANLFAGFRWLWRHPTLRALAVLCCLANLTLGGYTLLLLVLTRRLDATPAQTSVALLGAGLGAVLGPVVGAALGKRMPFAVVFLGGLLLESALWPLHLLAPSVLALGGIALLTMLADQVMNVAQYSLRLALFPEEVRGRAQAAYRLLLTLSQPIGLPLLGLGIERLGIETTTLIASATLAAGGLVALASPAVRGARSPRAAQEERPLAVGAPARLWSVDAWYDSVGPRGWTSIYSGQLAAPLDDVHDDGRALRAWLDAAPLAAAPTSQPRLRAGMTPVVARISGSLTAAWDLALAPNPSPALSSEGGANLATSAAAHDQDGNQDGNQDGEQGQVG